MSLLAFPTLNEAQEYSGKPFPSRSTLLLVPHPDDILVPTNRLHA